MNGQSLTLAVMPSRGLGVDPNEPAVPFKKRHEPLPDSLPEKRSIEGVMDLSEDECVVLPPTHRFVAFVDGVIYYHVDGDLRLRQMVVKKSKRGKSA